MILIFHKIWRLAISQQVRRLTFSLPNDIQSRIEELRLRASGTGTLLNQSEVVRAGIIALEQMDARLFAQVTADLRKLKPGRRPAGTRSSE